MPNGLSVATFGELKVLSWTPVRRTESGYFVYLLKCLCSCGNITFVRKSALISGKRKSCGCLRFIKKLDENVRRTMIEDVIRRFKKTALRRNHSWKLSDVEAESLLLSNCFYCGREPRNVLQYTGNRKLLYNGIDRIRNNKDYTILNVVPCCGDCNLAKRAQTMIGFLEQVKAIYENIGLQNLHENFIEEVAI